MEYRNKHKGNPFSFASKFRNELIISGFLEEKVYHEELLPGSNKSRRENLGSFKSFKLFANW